MYFNIYSNIINMYDVRIERNTYTVFIKFFLNFWGEWMTE